LLSSDVADSVASCPAGRKWGVVSLVVGSDTVEDGQPAGRIEDSMAPVVQPEDAALRSGEQQVIGVPSLAEARQRCQQ
jgi:hypothetical protein